MSTTQTSQGLIAGFGAIARHFPMQAAWVGLVAADIIVASGGFPALYELVRKWPTTSQRTSMIGLDQLCSAIEKACILYVRRAQCLQRSAVTVCTLRSCGISADLVIGCRPFPFAGHAWVEVGGVAVFKEYEGLRRLFAEIDRI